MTPKAAAAPKVAPSAPAAPGPKRRRRISRDDPPERRFPVIYRRLEKEYPDAKTALNFSNPHEMLFATIMSAQSTDVLVNRVTAKLFPKYPNLEDYANADRETLEADIKQTGFFRMKAKAIQGAARRILDVYGGKVPDTMAEILTLPGVARKTANVVLGNAYGVVQGIAVDTHVGRLARRLGLTKEKDPEKVERDLMKLVPKEHWTNWSHWLIWHGRRRCFARKPDCTQCEIFRLCPSGKIFLRTGVAREPKV